MKLLLTKCAICHDWFSPFRSHCPACNAAPIRVGRNTYKHVNATTGVIMVRGLNTHYFAEHAIEVAQTLMEKE